MLIELIGDDEQIKKAIEYLENNKVSVQEAGKDIIIDRESCVDCGECTSVCITGALSLDKRIKNLSLTGMNVYSVNYV